METFIANNPKNSSKYEEDGYMLRHDVAGTDPAKGYSGQLVILEQMSKVLTAVVKQPRTNFKEGFKSFAATQAFKESSYTGKTVWVRITGKNFLD